MTDKPQDNTEEKLRAFLETETIDRLFLELSQFTQATTRKELIFEKLLDEKEREIEELFEFANHYPHCIRNFWNAGEPTLNGGYREMYGDTWYQRKPIDETPKCDCGFDEILSKIAAKNLRER